MQLAIIDNGQVVKLDHYKALFPNVSFPTTGPDATFLQENSALEVTVWKPTTETQKLVSVEPYIEGQYVYTVQVVEKTQEELDAEAANLSAQKNAQTVSMRQARLALLKQGLLDTVNGAVQGLAGTEGEAARITWEYATEVKRGDALVTSLTTTLSWSEVQLDELFDLAAKL
jgi:hypothetical protein